MTVGKIDGGCLWGAGVLGCFKSAVHIYSCSLSFASFRFASPVHSDGCATPLFLVMNGLSSGYAVVGGGAPVGL